MPLRINGKMSQAQAALALSLADVPRHAAANRARHAAYRAALAGLPGLRILEYPAGEDNNFQYLVVDVEADTCGLTRDELSNCSRPRTSSAGALPSGRPPDAALPGRSGLPGADLPVTTISASGC